jgi:death on curing protein
MHAALTGGVHHLVRRAGLESAAGLPMQTWSGAFLYPSLFLMAGALLRSLAENQPFTDGNKRVAWAAAMVFLEINGVRVGAT